MKKSNQHKAKNLNNILTNVTRSPNMILSQPERIQIYRLEIFKNKSFFKSPFHPNFNCSPLTTLTCCLSHTSIETVFEKSWKQIEKILRKKKSEPFLKKKIPSSKFSLQNFTKPITTKVWPRQQRTTETEWHSRSEKKKMKNKKQKFLQKIKSQPILKKFLSLYLYSLSAFSSLLLGHSVEHFTLPYNKLTEKQEQKTSVSPSKIGWPKTKEIHGHPIWYRQGGSECIRWVRMHI